METAISSSPARASVATGARETQVSGVSWGAVLAGAFPAAALALVLLLLGTGLGLSAASPWANEGASAKTLGVAAIIWMIFVHLSSSAMGGYLAGRLRTKWVDLHTDEVYFRDTAHGLISWAVGIVITAAFLTSAATAFVGGTAKTAAMTAGAAAGGGTAAAAASNTRGPGADSNAYFIDTMFRSDQSREADDPAVREEVGRVFAQGLRQGELPAADRTYLAQVIASRTGLPPAEAEKRVSDALAQAKAAETKAREAADAARKAAAQLALWSFLALLIGAFTASYAATIGGRQRDRV
jgi:hypothetical protein